VNRLIRLSFGPFQLGDLEVGLVEEVRTRVLKDQLGKTLATQAGVDFESPVREPVSPFGSTKKSERDPSSAQGAARRNAARPTPAPRVSTGGAGSGPRNATWRADDGSKPRGTQIPRRGADPRSAQAAAAERGRERVGSIRAGERRVLVERLAATPVEPVAEATPRRRYADRSSPERPQRNTDGRPDREAGSARGFAPRGERGAGERVGGARSGGERAHGERAYGERPPREASRGSSGPRFEGRQDDRRGGKPGGRRDRPFDGPAGEGAPRGKGGFRPQRSASSDGKPAFGGGKPGGGFRAGSARPGGKPGGKPGGFSGKGAGTRPGGRPGGRDGAKPGGGRPPRGTR
jgi:23S rRNA pseudouridine2605 synthase